MIPGVFFEKWPFFLWLISGFVSREAPLTCVATTKEKGSMLVADEDLFRRSYKLEDFFWTGSGDGPLGEETLYNLTEEEPHPLFPEHISTWRTTTIFHTTTILFATVYPNIKTCSNFECKPKISPVWTRSVEFSSPVHSSYGIEPTPTEKHQQRTTKLRNVTVFSEITKVLTVTEKVSASGKTSRHGPEKTSVNTQLSTVASSFNNGSDAGGSDGREGSGAAFPRFDIDTNATSTGIYSDILPDQRYWLLTVLKCDTLLDGVKIRLIEEKLSNLYKKAFIRQQDKHFGINGNSVTTSRPRRDRRIPEPVKVRIHNVTDAFGKNSQEVAILYSVTVAGKPVPALTAANDMKLIPLNEVVAELGYPVLTKAEPYSKEIIPLGARIKGRSRDTWLLIGAVIAAVSLLIILAVIFTFGLSNGEENGAATGTNNKKQVFEVEEGSCNLAFREDSDLKIKIDRTKSPGHKSGYDNVGASGISVTFADQRRGSSSSSSCSGSSEASLVRLRCQQKKRDQKKEGIDEKPRPKPRTRMRRVKNEDITLEDAQGTQILRASTEKRDKEMSNEGIEGIEDVELSSRNTRTPTSYLSMPSVKAFPRGAKIPEPLNRVLEPISIRYLDGDADNLSRSKQRHRIPDENYDNDVSHNRSGKFRKETGMTRHASLEGDPGVVGPFVWKGQYLKTNSYEKDVYGFNEINGNVNVGKMRKRFSDLIDDAFNLFGSRGENSGEGERCGSDFVPGRPSDARIHSALIRPVESFYNFSSGTRPKTTDSRRPLTVALKQGPRGAWDSPDCSTPSKRASSSAVIDENSILVDGNFPPGDPAIPLIKAIKDELQKFDQGSTKPGDNTPIN